MGRKIKINSNGNVEIEHFDSGGTVIGQQANGNAQGIQGVANNATNGISSAGNTLQNAATGATQFTAAPAGGVLGGLAQAFTTQNQYQAGLAPTSQFDYLAPASQAGGNALQGYGNYQNVAAQQQNLANALGNQVQGHGANPAQAALNQQTGNNIASQSSLQGSQRGASNNVGLEARQAAQQGGSLQQQAVGQGATLQAQQQLAAEQELAAQQNNQQASNVAEQNSNNALYNGSATANNAQNNTNVNNYSMAQGINSQVSQNNANAVNKTEGGLTGGFGSALTSLLYKGGVAGDASNPKLAAVAKKDRMPMPEHIKGMANLYHPQKFADGGDVIQVPSEVTPQTDYYSSSKSSGGGGGGGLLSLLALNKGAVVPGKPKVDHDDKKNDVVPAMLTPKEIVLPLDVTESDNPGEAAKDFVEKLLAKHGSLKKNKEQNDFHHALKKAISSRKS